MSLVRTATVAQSMRNAAMAGVQQQASVHYTQDARRWDGIARRILGPHQPSFADCSAYVTWLAWQARVKHRGGAGGDVMNGTSWTSGWTGTLLAHGRRHTSTRWWKPGRTLVFYGSPVDHVALYVGGGMVVSHGAEAGPMLLHYQYRPDFNQARAYNV